MGISSSIGFGRVGLMGVIGFLVVLVSPAPKGDAAEEATSFYSRFIPEECPQIKGKEHLRRCPGKRGVSLIYSERHVSEEVAFDPWYADGRYDNDSQNFIFSHYGRQYAHLWRNKKKQVTVEWRTAKGDANAKPYAAIIRFASRAVDDCPNVQTLTVIKIDDTGSCVVGAVDASSKKNAGQLARQIADTVARKADCTKDRAWSGKSFSHPGTPKEDINWRCPIMV